MPSHLAGIRLKNYCGYKEEVSLNFLNKNDEPNRIIVIYGPNGEGKSSLLEAIRLVGNTYIYHNRDCRLLFRKLTYNEDYDPTYGFMKDAKNNITTEHLDRVGTDIEENDPSIKRNEIDFEAEFDKLVENNPYNMEVEGAFDTDEGFKTVFIETAGLVHSDMPLQRKGYIYWIDADNPSHLTKFQLDQEYSDKFLEIAKAVYGYDCFFPHEAIIESYKDKDKKDVKVNIYTDFVINKNGTHVHYKRMSAGEKKIATLLSFLCDPLYIDLLDIIVIDNVELHIYFKRHGIFIDKLLEMFPEKQFIVTTHSGVLIDHVSETYGKECLFDLEMIKKGSRYV